MNNLIAENKWLAWYESNFIRMQVQAVLLHKHQLITLNI